MGCLEAAMVPLVGDEVRRGYTGINSLNLRIVCSSPYRPTKHIERTIHKYEEYNTIHPKRGSLGRCSVVGPMPLGRASGTLLADIGIPWWKRQGRSTGVPGRPGVGISQQAPTNPLRAPRNTVYLVRTPLKSWPVNRCQVRAGTLLGRWGGVR